mmetsp:Transcript_3937/g.5363  ORF Transcript_3937/g.5363 Transcript_3937/m.5363 type:complete len:290 (-) Transcript_3937:423-1292(-)
MTATSSDSMGVSVPHSRPQMRSSGGNNQDTSATSRLSIPSGSGDNVHSKQTSSMGGVGKVFPYMSNSPSSISYDSSSPPSSFTYLSSIHSSSMSPPAQYLTRLLDFSQMDIQCALNQMRSLLSFSPAQTQKVYKLAYYRKQTKNHWARDDPAFVALQIAFLVLSSLSYCIAFGKDHLISSAISFAFHGVFVNFLGAGLVVATIGRFISNSHLAVQSSSAHVRQGVEWLYAFDIHCNAFFPLFALLYGLHFFLLPLVLGAGLLPFLMSNTLFAIAFVWYFYVTHLGYRGK